MGTYTDKLFAMVAFLEGLGMSQRQIADDTGVSQATISRLSRREPAAYDVPTLEKVEALFNKLSRAA